VTIVAVLPWEPKMGILPVIHLLVFVIAKTMLEVCMKFTSNIILSPGFIIYFTIALAINLEEKYTT
jgi:hypothetical protein